MKTLRLLLIMNNTNWASLDEKIKSIKQFFSPKFNLIINVKNTNFNDIPFAQTQGISGVSGKDIILTTDMVEPVWYDQNITMLGLAYHFVLFYVDGKNTVGHLVSAGIRGDADTYPVELTLFGLNETDHAYQNGVDLGNDFVLFACHEISHAVYMMLGLTDNTHIYFYGGSPSKVLNDWSFGLTFFQWIKKQLSKLTSMNKSQLLYQTSKSLIGQHLTLDESVPKEYGCAEAVSYVLKDFGLNLPEKGIAGTVGMEKWLLINCTEVSTPQAGDIIISVSFTGLAGARGHIGIVGYRAIMSNASDTGLWSTYWSLGGWLGFYKDSKKLRTRYFRV